MALMKNFPVTVRPRFSFLVDRHYMYVYLVVEQNSTLALPGIILGRPTKISSETGVKNRHPNWDGGFLTPGTITTQLFGQAGAQALKYHGRDNSKYLFISSIFG